MLVLLSDYQSHVEFIKGSPSHDEDLKAARIDVADTVLVSTNHNNLYDDVTDILATVAIKNANPKVRVLIQTVKGSSAVGGKVPFCFEFVKPVWLSGVSETLSGN